MSKIKGFLHRPHELAIAELMGYQSTLSEATLSTTERMGPPSARIQSHGYPLIRIWMEGLPMCLLVEITLIT